MKPVSRPEDGCVERPANMADIYTGYIDSCEPIRMLEKKFQS